MRYRFLLAALHLLSAWLVSAATAPIYINRSPVHAPPDVAPQIDARAFVNLSVFDVNLYNSLYALPYQTLNTARFTNSGVMYGSPGYRFDYFTGNTRRPMNWWINAGDISSFNTNRFYYSFYGSLANWVLVSASNIVNSGVLAADGQGLIQLEGAKMDLAQGRFRTGAPINRNYYFYGGGYLGMSNYWNDLGVSDYYWAEGTNNTLRGGGNLMRLDLGSNGYPNFTLPNVRSEIHDAIFYYGYTNSVLLPYYGYIFGSNGYYSPKAYTAAAFTNGFGTNRVVQVVFYPTNDVNLDTQVRFYRDTDGGATAIVGFHTVETDPVLDVTYTNSVYLLDALAFETNVFLARNVQYFTRRPSTYEVTRDTPYQFASYFSEPPNAAYDNTMLYNPSHLSNAVRVAYTAYAAQIQPFNFIATGIPAQTDPTNYPGRIEITGQEVNLDETRIRAETTLNLRADNLTGNRQMRVSAPFLNVDLGSTQPVLTISNLAAPSVHRVSGFIYAWSVTWQNIETNAVATNNIRFHVLMVDHDFASELPVTVNTFAARVTNGTVVISDALNVQQKLQVTAHALTVQGALTFPPSADWTKDTIRFVRHFTNEGIVRVTGGATAGPDRPNPYDDYINHGTCIAGAHYISANNVENSRLLQADAGPLSITSDMIRLQGQPTVFYTNVWTNFFLLPTLELSTNYYTNVSAYYGAALVAAGDLELNSGTLLFSNVFLQTGDGSMRGAIKLSATNQLRDAGTKNQLITSAGFQLLTRPSSGDLRATYILSQLGSSRAAPHVWAARDRGATAIGFSNNLALGKLTLDGGTNSVFQFAGAMDNCALYVDYLELLNSAAFHNAALQIAPSLTIYFANANVPPSKLDGTHNGRLRWVKSYAGPLSSTNIIYYNYAAYPPSSRTYTFNIALVQNKDRDDDGDGIVNFEDPTPVYVAESVGLSIRPSEKSSSQVLLSWQALANAASYLEYKPSATATNAWRVLYSFTNNQTATRLWTTNDDLAAGRTQRVYRVRVLPPPL